MLGEKLSHVQLAYNPKTGEVGLRAAAADAPGAYQLRPQSKSVDSPLTPPATTT